MIPKSVLPYVDDVTLLAARNLSGSGNNAPTPRVPTSKHMMLGANNGRHIAKKADAPDGKKSSNPDVPDDINANKFADELDGISGHLGMGVMAAQLGVPAAAGAIGWVGTQTNSSMLKSTAGALRKTGEITFEELGAKTGLSGIGRTVAEAGSGVASVVTRGLEALGITGVAASHYAGKFNKHAGKMMQSAQGVFAHNVNHGELNAALGEIRSHLSAPPVAMNYDELGKAVEKARTLANDIGHTPLTKSLKALEKNALKAETSLFFADGYQNLTHYTKNAASKMGKANVLHGAMNATFVAGAAISDYRTITDLHRSLKNLKTMHAHLTGQKEEDISGMGLMFGKVPEPVAQARSELIKEFGPAVVLDAANTVLNIKFAVNSKFGSMAKSMMLLVALPMANAMISRGLLGGHLLPTYNKMKDLECKGQEVPPEMYATLIGSASKDLYSRGGEDSNFAKALSIFYAEHHAKADTVLKEVDNGTLKKRIVQLQQEYDQYLKEHPEVAQAQAEAKAAQAAPKESSFVDKVTGRGKSMARDVVGDHTAKLAHQGAHEHAHGVPGVA